MTHSSHHVYSLVVVCHGNDEMPGLPTFNNFQHQCQEIQLGAGSLTEARFWMHSSGSTAGFLYKAAIQKISKNQKLELYTLYDPNFQLYILYIVPFSKERVVTAVMVSVGCVTRPILALGCPVSRADSAGLRDMRQGHAESIFSNTFGQPL